MIRGPAYGFVRTGRGAQGGGEKEILVVCAPRSGSHYMARALCAVDLSVGHERVGRDGCVSSYFAVDDYWYQGPHGSRERRSAFRWRRIWHLIRNPLDTIGSLLFRIRDPWWHWQEKHTGIGREDPDAAARFWIEWTERIASDPEVERVIKVEEVKDRWTELCALLGKAPVWDPHLNPSLGKTQGAERASLDLFDPRVAEAIEKKMHQYGYE